MADAVRDSLRQRGRRHRRDGKVPVRYFRRHREHGGADGAALRTHADQRLRNRSEPRPRRLRIHSPPAPGSQGQGGDEDVLPRPGSSLPAEGQYGPAAARRHRQREILPVIPDFRQGHRRAVDRQRGHAAGSGAFQRERLLRTQFGGQLPPLPVPTLSIPYDSIQIKVQNAGAKSVR